MKKAIEINFPFEEIDPIAERESYRKEINRPIYHTHKWWAQRLGSVFRALIIGATEDETVDIWESFYSKHNFSGKVVLDPFMGSGTTLGEAIKLGHKAVGCDINPVSSFIVSQALRSISPIKLTQAFHELESKVKKKINVYYQKTHPVTGEECQVLYYFWVKLVTTPTGKKLPLFSNYVFSRNAYVKKKPSAKIICPKCYSINEARYDATCIDCISCSLSFNPQTGPAQGQYVYDFETDEKFKILDLVSRETTPPEHKLYAVLVQTPQGTKEYLKVTEQDVILYNQAKTELKSKDLKFPVGAIEPGHNTNQAIRYNYFYWKDFFNDRQLLCLNYLIDAILQIEESDIKDAFLCLFSGVLEFNNMFCSFKGEGTGAVRHLFYNHILKPERTPLENSIWGTSKSSGSFFSLFKSRLLKAQEYRDKPFEISAKESGKILCSSTMSPKKAECFEELADAIEPSYLILNGDSSTLPIPDESVDAVVTDPPYFDFVHYSELSDFFYAWLKPALKEHKLFQLDNSRRKGEVQHKDQNTFAEALGEVFKECNRVMKNDAVLTFSFHHSKIEGWLAIYKAIELANLEIENFFPVKAEMSVAAPKSKSKSPINLDAILICKKRYNKPESDSSFVWKEAKNVYTNLSGRFKNIGRYLSVADESVIMIASLLTQSSRAGLSYKQLQSALKGIELKELIEIDLSDKITDLNLELRLNIA